MSYPKLSIKNRWLVALGAIFIQLALGIIYAWSVFTPSLLENGWTKVQTQYVFSTALAMFAISMVIAGKMFNKNNAKKMAQIGGLVLSAAYILAGLLAAYNPVLIILLIGVLGGIGIGISYVVPIAVSVNWFPDKKGLIAGLAVAGFGFGATLWIKLAGSWGNLLVNFGLSKTFIIYGLLLLAMILFGSIYMVFPSTDLKLIQKNKAKTKKAGLNLPAKQMLKSFNFYKIFATFMFSASAGLMTIGLMKIFPQEALLNHNPNLSIVQASAIAGTAMAVFFSLANGSGRIIWGSLSDKLGRKKSLIIMTISQALLMFTFPYLAGVPALLYLSATLIGFNFGGNFSLFPTMTADVFGNKYLAQNYGWIFLSYGVGGIIGPILGGKLGDLNNFSLAFSICGVMCLIAAGIISQVEIKTKRAE